MANKRIKRICIIAMISAVAVASRIALIAVPQIKPVLAIIILVGSVYGSLDACITGITTMVISNMIMGQGPWTVWQIIAVALVGLISGLIKFKNKYIFPLIGGFLTIFVYGVVMNLGSVFMFQSELSISKFLIFEISGLPFDVIHGVSTTVFLFIFSGYMRDFLVSKK